MVVHERSCFLLYFIESPFSRANWPGNPAVLAIRKISIGSGGDGDVIGVHWTIGRESDITEWKSCWSKELSRRSAGLADVATRLEISLLPHRGEKIGFFCYDSFARG